ncbi:N-acetylglucosamine-6-phosphate deacetylase [Aliirhizobium cellulosilyticum]|jgi:N-acetylglucosamine-6-phosphate deacetylase|uniref:N-acetylglucosamine-6-phosphate deacetylase n=1 Tax=Aliirhizobium cellulosilyticum TaxID=393664 RepID=A0A7W6TFT1_9HYPH|nr:N-acetylglucosamine-6-phosphate deacetylase [Rhizobium cellulosilyticum]MBB4349156.1 N-acetylglucosamine-6-phosphate deacetylase [Rhizobium cellulosilyticum]MBB4412623.1 N-acetylglucosamine-6-phosphate deacetylase [Rhizobium cellulosilyticum]MBB4447255.1 N-acetylglucosamine-6-phosphate deacetylase [Rhizobium cellulosilyticum]
MTQQKALIGKRVFDGSGWHEDAAVIFEGGKITGILPVDLLSADMETIEGGEIIAPGFIDLQVNGGGGVLLNEEPTVEGIATICAAHAKFGTTALLPTLITDTFEITSRTVAAGIEAKKQGVAGFLGLHLEGPHLSLARKGAHDPALIRPMEEQDLELILSCGEALDALMVTIAPESVSPEQVNTLARAGITVSLGHTEASYDTARLYATAGARTVTHLFNAMSPLGHREPGMVGAALDTRNLHAGLIADGIHVHPAAMAAALRAKNGPGKIFLVTDAMSPIGTDMTSFTLNGREILRHDGRLTLADGTLAGADIDMAACVRLVHETLDLPLEEALRMASAYPADAVQIADKKGSLKPGFDADFVVLDASLHPQRTWIGGVIVYQA